MVTTLAILVVSSILIVNGILISAFVFFSALCLGGGNPFQSIEKTAILQETRLFNETPVNARKCTHILTKILYLINQVGEIVN